MTQELGPNQRKWVEELRSGKYQQATQALCRGGAYCCLGVACQMMGLQSRPGAIHILDENAEDVLTDVLIFGGETTSAPDEVVEHLSLRTSVGGDAEDNVCLAEMNDEGATFAQIADAIESDPANWFTAPK